MNALCDEPRAALTLDPEQARELLVQLGGLVEMLRVAAVQSTARANGNADDHQATDGADRLLDAEAVALRLGIDVDSVSRRKFPFAVKVGRRTVRYSEAGLDEFMARGGGR